MSVTHELVIDDNGNLKRVPIGQGLGAGEIRIDTSQIEQLLCRYSTQLSEATDLNRQLRAVIYQHEAVAPQIPAGTPIFESREVLVDVGVVLSTRTLMMEPGWSTNEWWPWNAIRGANTVGFVLDGPGRFSFELNNHGFMSQRYDVRPGMMPIFDIPESRREHRYSGMELEIRFQVELKCEPFSVTVVIGKK